MSQPNKPNLNFRQALDKYLRGSRWSVYSAKPAPKPLSRRNNRLRSKPAPKPVSKPAPKPAPKPVAIPARLRRVRRCSRR